MEQRGKDPPACVEFVVSDKVGVITLQRIKDERLIGFGDLEIRESSAVREIELSDDSLHAQAGQLRIHLQVYALVGLDTDDEFVPRNVLKDSRGHILELDSNLRLLLVERFSSLHNEGNAVPALVLDVGDEGAEGGAPRIGGHSVVLLVRRLGAVEGPSVLPDNDVLRFNSGHSAENAHLLVTDILCGEGDGPLHGKEGEDLEQVVLHDVSNNAELVKVSPAALGSEGLLESDLNVIDVMPVPRRVEEGVTESENQQVFHHLFSEVVVNSEELILLPVRLKVGLKLSRAR